MMINDETGSLPLSGAFRMRPLSWTLLALLLILIVLVVAPHYSGDYADLLRTSAASVALAVLSAGMWLIRRINRRLAQLATVATRIGRGDYSSRVPDDSADAIGLVGRELNGMAAKIGSVIGTLENQQSELHDNRARLEAQHDQLGREYQRQASFGEFLSSINTVDVNTIANKSLGYLLNLASAQLGQVYSYDETSQLLLKISERGIDRRALKKLAGGSPMDGLPGAVLARKEAVRIDTLREDNLPRVNLGFASAELRCVLGLPVLFQDRLLGVVLIGALQAPDERSMRGIQNALDALGSALNNALTYKTVQQQALRLEQANQELLEADRLRSEFVANMSHELRTPLNSIIGFSGVMQKNRQGTLSRKDLDYVEKINRNGKHLLGLINDILDLSKIEAGRMDLHFEPTRAEGVVHDVLEMLKTQAEAKQLTLTVEAEPELGEITTDIDKLKQVLINLVGNALKFTHNGGIDVRLGADLPANALTIAVSDSGIGIPADKIDAIFEPFRQADSGTTRQYGGTGLGLAITRSIVEMLGGKITVTSEPDQGSTFSVTLPIAPDRSVVAQLVPPHPAAEPAPSAVAGETNLPSLATDPHGQTVLIVDDDDDARELLGNYIEELGATPIAAAGGLEALQLARQYRPSLITLDLMMPDMDGWEVLRQLKADPVLAEIPVIIISIVAEKRQALILGATDALSKPIAQDDLLNILSRCLSSASHGRVLAVDDNPEVLELYRTLLEDEVAELRTASDGKEALGLLQDYRPDIIFLDLMMPEIDGLTFLRMLRTEKKLMNLPVVIVTAKQLSAAERRELEMRVVQIIEKGEADLENQLRNTLQQVLLAGKTPAPPIESVASEPA